jgi:hypothetical protein
MRRSVEGPLGIRRFVKGWVRDMPPLFALIAVIDRFIAGDPWHRALEIAAAGVAIGTVVGLGKLTLLRRRFGDLP